MQNMNIDPRKMALINEFQKLSKGKGSKDMLPLFLAITQKANSMGLQFTKEEIQQVIGILSQDMSPEEKNNVNMVMNMMTGMNK